MSSAAMKFDYFFQNNWKRLRDKFQDKTINRHETSLMTALYNRRERTLNALCRVGSRTFATQIEAEDYLVKLPEGYSGRSHQTESRRWMVSYRQEGN